MGWSGLRCRSAREMEAAVQARFPGVDALLMAAAVGDYRPGPGWNSKRSSGARRRCNPPGPKPRYPEEREPAQEPAGGGGVRGGDPRSGGRGPAQAAGEEPGSHCGQRRQPAGFRLSGGHQRSHPHQPGKARRCVCPCSARKKWRNGFWTGWPDCWRPGGRR